MTHLRLRNHWRRVWSKPMDGAGKRQELSSTSARRFLEKRRSSRRVLSEVGWRHKGLGDERFPPGLGRHRGPSPSQSASPPPRPAEDEAAVRKRQESMGFRGLIGLIVLCAAVPAPAMGVETIDVLVRGGTAVTMDGAYRGIEDGAVASRGDRIVAVRPSPTIA